MSRNKSTIPSYLPEDLYQNQSPESPHGESSEPTRNNPGKAEAVPQVLVGVLVIILMIASAATLADHDYVAVAGIALLAAAVTALGMILMAIDLTAASPGDQR